MHNPWTETTLWWRLGVGVGEVKKGTIGRLGDTYNTFNNTGLCFFLKKKQYLNWILMIGWNLLAEGQEEQQKAVSQGDTTCKGLEIWKYMVIKTRAKIFIRTGSLDTVGAEAITEVKEIRWGYLARGLKYHENTIFGWNEVLNDLHWSQGIVIKSVSCSKMASITTMLSVIWVSSRPSGLLWSPNQHKDLIHIPTTWTCAQIHCIGFALYLIIVNLWKQRL